VCVCVYVCVCREASAGRVEADELKDQLKAALARVTHAEEVGVVCGWVCVCVCVCEWVCGWVYTWVWVCMCVYV